MVEPLESTEQFTRTVENCRRPGLCIGTARISKRGSLADAQQDTFFHHTIGKRSPVVGPEQANWYINKPQCRGFLSAERAIYRQKNARVSFCGAGYPGGRRGEKPSR